MRYLIGIDEAGRAPLAGPVAVGVARVPQGFDWSQIGGIRDSKKMTPRARERFFMQMQTMRHDGVLDFAVAFASHTQIDAIGITKAVRSAMVRALRSLEAHPEESNIFLDGALYAPEEYRYQQTIIGGDDVLPIISVAAIAAKVSRDRLMMRLAKKYPGYGFEIHKGYPTAAHRQAIRERGMCELHRRTFCRNVLGLSAGALQSEEISV